MKNGIPLSTDLRQRVMQAREDNDWSQEETARFFDVGLTTIKDWCRLVRETGSLEPRPHGGGHRFLIDEKGLEKIRLWVLEKPDLTIKELCVKFSKQVKPVSTSTISRALQRLGLTFKKKSYLPAKKKRKMFRDGKLNS